jgi:transposase-like protein
MRRRFSDADRQRSFVELDRSGESAWRVAHRLSLSPNSAYRWLEARKEAGPVFARVLRSDSESPAELAVQVGAARILVSPSFDPELLRACLDEGALARYHLDRMNVAEATPSTAPADGSGVDIQLWSTALVALALLVLGVLLIRRKRLKSLHLDIGAGTLDAEVATPAGATVRDAKSRAGSILADDGTGAGATVERVSAHGDIVASTGTTRPKA